MSTLVVLQYLTSDAWLMALVYFTPGLCRYGAIASRCGYDGSTDAGRMPYPDPLAQTVSKTQPSINRSDARQPSYTRPSAAVKR